MKKYFHSLKEKFSAQNEGEINVNEQGIVEYENYSTSRGMLYFLMAFIVLFISIQAFAGTGGTEFNDLVDMVVGWSEGGLGKSLAVIAFLLGGAIGMMRSTMMPMLVGLGFGLAFTMGPGIIQSMFTAIV